jgi:hypothetical protein
LRVFGRTILPSAPSTDVPGVSVCRPGLRWLTLGSTMDSWTVRYAMSPSRRPDPHVRPKHFLMRGAYLVGEMGLFLLIPRNLMCCTYTRRSSGSSIGSLRKKGIMLQFLPAGGGKSKVPSRPHTAMETFVWSRVAS